MERRTQTIVSRADDLMNYGNEYLFSTENFRDVQREPKVNFNKTDERGEHKCNIIKKGQLNYQQHEKYCA